METKRITVEVQTDDAGMARVLDKARAQEATSELQAHEARCSVAAGSASGFLELLAGVVEAERLVVAGLSPEMPCRKMHENRHRAFREALSMARAYFQPNIGNEPRR